MGGVDKHLNNVHYVPTSYGPKDAQGKRDILWGGVKDGKPVGATAGYLGPRYSKQIKGVIAIGGGPIAVKEAQYAKSLGIPINYIKAEAKNPKANGKYGSMHAYAKNMREGFLP